LAFTGFRRAWTGWVSRRGGIEGSRILRKMFVAALSEQMMRLGGRHGRGSADPSRDTGAHFGTGASKTQGNGGNTGLSNDLKTFGKVFPKLV
jgi:hypothetical protein